MFRLNVRTRLARFKPQEPLPDPRAVEVMYDASEILRNAKRLRCGCLDICTNYRDHGVPEMCS